jgi:hypothetical protein
MAGELQGNAAIAGAVAAQIRAQDETIRSGLGERLPRRMGVSGGAASFRSRLDDYLTRLMRGELEAAVEAHFAPEGRLYENGGLRAEGAEAVRRKLAPVARRHAMLRGTLDGLECDRFAGTATFRIRFDGVDVDGRILREEVTFRQCWHLGRIVEEHQERRTEAGAHRAQGPARAPLRLVAGAGAVL